MHANTGDWSGQRVSLSQHGGTAVLRLFNPPLGYMDETMESELAHALDRLERWPGARGVVLTGRDTGMFVRHYAVAVLHQRAQALRGRGKTFSLDRPLGPAGIHRCLERMDKSPLLFIAAINGVAMGGGFELALGCDIRLVQSGDHAMGLPELNLGLLPGASGTQVLARMLGTGQALSPLLTAKVPAESGGCGPGVGKRGPRAGACTGARPQTGGRARTRLRPHQVPGAQRRPLERSRRTCGGTHPVLRLPGGCGRATTHGGGGARPTHDNGTATSHCMSGVTTPRAALRHAPAKKPAAANAAPARNAKRPLVTSAGGLPSDRTHGQGGAVNGCRKARKCGGAKIGRHENCPSVAGSRAGVGPAKRSLDAA